MRHYLWFIVFAVATCHTIALGGLSLAPTLASADARPWQGELPVRDAWLREHLPDDAVVYLRLPNLLGVFTMPKGNALDAALRSRTNVENVARLRQGIAENLLAEIPAFADPRLRAFEQHIRSPIEVAATLYPAPSIVMSVNLDFATAAAFEDFMRTLGGQSPALALAAPLTDTGVAQLPNFPYPAFLRYDEDSGRLVLNAGPAVTPESFDELVQTLDRRSAHAMRAMEARVDESGQGLFLWIDTEQALPMLRMFVSPEQLAPLSDLGLDRVSAAAIGWGVADSKGRLAVVAELPDDQDRGLIPFTQNDVSARSVGEPDGVILLSIPSGEEFTRLEAAALAAAGSGDEWSEAKREFAEQTGVELEEFFSAVGPELLVVFDRAGDYGAVRLRDRRLWDSILDRLVENAAFEISERCVAGRTYYHLSGPSQGALAGGDDADGTPGWLGEIMSRQRDHLYWTRDGDYLYLASVPQPLIDRAAMGARTDVGEWLENRQRIDADNAVLSMSGTTEKLPRRLYGVYIELLQLLADLSMTEIDVWSMPTAAQLELPETGTLGLTLSLGSPTLFAELVFENNPTEFLGGVGAAATAGVLAAIAIPAYQDYTVRARLSEGLILAGPVQAGVEAHYTQHGAFPDTDGAASMSVFDPSESVQSIVVEAGSGRIVIDYDPSVAADGARLYLDPEPGPVGEIAWSCSSSLEQRWLPAACRD